MAKIEGIIQICVGCLVLKKAKAAGCMADAVADENAAKPAKSLHEIGRRLLQLLTVSIPLVDVRALEELWPAEAEENAPTKSKAAAAGGRKAPAQLELLEYDSYGQVTSTVAKLRSKGLDAGSTVALKGE